MRTKIAAVCVVALFLAVPLILITDDSEAVSENKTVYPYDKWNTRAWVSTSDMTYNGDPSTDILYFNGNPSEDIVKVANGTMDYSDLNNVEPVEGALYYAAGFTSYTGIYSSVTQVPVEPQIFYLDAGTYTINIVSAHGDEIYLRNANDLVDSKGGDSERITLSEGRGSVEIELRIPSAFYFNAYSSYSWVENPITYNVDPEPTAKTVSSYSQSATVVANKQWVSYTTNEPLNGRVQLYDSISYTFAKGSAEDNAFLDNVVRQNKIDGSAYKSPSTTIDLYGQQLVTYKLVNVGEGDRSYDWIYIDETYSESNYQNVRVELTTERFETGDDVNSKLYAGKNFSLAVKYDTSRILFVAIGFPTLYGSIDYVPLESEKLYSFEMDCASEYQLFAMVKDSSDSLDAVEVEIYTDGIATPDDGGYIFAGIAIVLCALAFGTLFMAGRRPKWKENAGLPDYEATMPDDAESSVEDAAETEVPDDTGKQT